ncbi:DMT family transporter [Sediminibacterium ginsengisoli]|uniref:EamA domain-containing membrane protein RarD n=1 Tax=Sediminibacterium ginsengisoli TaxID=413434 RepID=A0A1T4QFY9_9BACT|nr:DMT family transporter [Sediminibacterium ginsengisoli]SKA02703.1 EamA domain-containing membrane protein RarD [Sediminibacterium ginsengisoli]
MTSQPSQRITLAGFIITLLGAIFFSTKAIIVKLAFQDTKVDALTLLTLRMLFSLPFYILAIWLGARKEKATPLSTKQWLQVAVTGILGYYLSSLFDFIGLQYVSAGLERLILFLYPTFAVLINTFLFKSPLHRTQVIALLLTYTGIGIAYAGELHADTSAPGFFYGSFMIFLCAVTYSLYLVGTGRLVNKTGATRYTAYTMMAATAGIFIHFALTKPLSSISFTPALTGYSIALAIVATVLPSFMMSNGMKRIGSNNVAIITSIGPVSTILQAYYILGEPLLPLQLFGTFLVIVGVLIIGRKAGKEQAA